jgi:hypothetical protein
MWVSYLILIQMYVHFSLDHFTRFTAPQFDT